MTPLRRLLARLPYFTLSAALTLACCGSTVVRAGDEATKPASADLLFTDPIGHAKPPLEVLVAYCYYAQVYGRSPVGLPVPPALKIDADVETTAKLNQLLQEIAWTTVTEHPLSGVNAN